MRDIVATIQSDQYRLITAEPDGALVVQGGPGTGQDRGRAAPRVVAPLHAPRAAAPRARRRAEPDVHGLRLARAAGARRGGGRAARGVGAARRDRGRARGRRRRRAAEGGHAARRGRAARGRARGAADAGGARALRGRRVRLGAGAPGARAARRGARVRRRRSRRRASGSAWRVLRRFYERYGELLEDLALRSFDEIERALQRKRLPRRSTSTACSRCRGRTSSSRGCSTSPAALAEAADGILERDEQQLLLRDRPKRASDLRWSEHDLPLLDVARTLVDGPPRAYGHVIVDEAQDLSPMQLLDGVAARARRLADDPRRRRAGDRPGRLPRAGRSSSRILPDEVEVTIEELRHAYRVPGRDHGLRAAAARSDRARRRAPLAYRQGGEPPRLVAGRRGRAARRRCARRAPSSTGCSR